MNRPEPIDTSKLIPLVRSRFYHEATKLRIAANMPAETRSFAGQHAYKVLGTHLAVSIAVDLPQHYRHLTRDDLDTLGMTFDQALETAKQNLASDAARLPAGISFDSVKEGFHFPAGDVADHNSSLILYPDAFRGLPLSGDPILFLPHTDMFWVTGSHQEDVVSLLCGLTMQEMEDRPDRPITTIPFILVGDQWQAWQPDSAHRSYWHVRELYVSHEAMAYDAQRRSLRQQFEATGRDLHVAKYQPVVDSSSQAVDQTRGLTVWTETVPSLLPKAELVRMQRLLNRDALERGAATVPEIGEAIYVRWDRLQQRLGSALRPQEMYPERYLAEHFPDEATWHALRQDAVSLSPELEWSLRSADHAGLRKPGSKITPNRRSAAKLVGIGCVLGCGGSIAALFGLAILLTVANRFQPLRRMHAGEFELLRPSVTYSSPSPKDFEDGDLGKQRVAVHQQIPRDLPPFGDLPNQPLPALRTSIGPPSETGLAGHESGHVFRDRPPPAGILVGLRLTKGQEWGGAIRALQPIYQVDGRYVLGQVHGPDQGVDQIQYLAGPGYAVGAIRVRAGLALNAMQIEFHSMSANEQQEDKVYATKWFGCPGGAHFELTGGPFVGVDGCVVKEIVSLQLLRVNAPGD